MFIYVLFYCVQLSIRFISNPYVVHIPIRNASFSVYMLDDTSSMNALSNWRLDWRAYRMNIRFKGIDFFSPLALFLCSVLKKKFFGYFIFLFTQWR